MDKKKAACGFENMPIEEKLKLLNDTDKAFIRGYIERALIEQQRKSTRKPKSAK